MGISRMKVLIALVGIAIAVYAFLALSKKPDRTLSKLDEALRFGTRLSETPRGSSSLIESNEVEVRVGGLNADVTEIHRLKYEVNRNGFMTIVVPDGYVDYLDSDRLASVLQENLYTMVTLPDGEILTRRAEP